MAEFVNVGRVLRCREVTRTTVNGVIYETWGDFRPLSACSSATSRINRSQVSDTGLPFPEQPVPPMVSSFSKIPAFVWVLLIVSAILYFSKSR